MLLSSHQKYMFCKKDPHALLTLFILDRNRHAYLIKMNICATGDTGVKEPLCPVHTIGNSDGKSQMDFFHLIFPIVCSPILPMLSKHRTAIILQCIDWATNSWEQLTLVWSTIYLVYHGVTHHLRQKNNILGKSGLTKINCYSKKKKNRQNTCRIEVLFMMNNFPKLLLKCHEK